MQLQLYMASIMKPYILEQHDFYVAQTNMRVLAQFQDLEGEADRHAEDEYKRLLARPGPENTDLAETAHDRAIGFYGLLADLKQQVILGALAGLYHQWEKELREFIERELMHYVQKEEVMKIAWKDPITDIFDLLIQFGWAIRTLPFFSLIDACRLIVNVYKHGKGRSLEELNRDYPQYLRDPFGSDVPVFIKDYLDHTLLTVSEEHFTEVADALRAFWVEFPERLYLTV
jgi:hypothetical protein